MTDKDLFEDLLKLRVSVARIAQAAHLDIYIPGAKERINLSFEELYQCAHEETGWNTLCAIIIGHVERQ